MTPFTLAAPARTLFGRGCRAQAADEIAAMGRAVLLVRGRSVPWADALEQALRAAGATVTAHVARGEPTLEDVRRAAGAARTAGADCIVSVGGGAVIDLGKAVAGLAPSGGDPVDHLELGPAPAKRLPDPLRFVAVPTTAGTGAEATRNAVLGVPERQAKISLRDPRLVPDLALVDPALTDGLPRALTLATGLDAITQLVESYLSRRANPVTDALCRSEIVCAVAALATLMDSEQPDARDALARASYLSGLALANSGLGVVHGLASVIGGRGGAHGAICGRLLVPSLAVNRAAVVRAGGDPSRFDAVSGWLDEGLGTAPGEGPAALRALADRNGLPTLAELHVPRGDFAAMAQAARGASSTRANPVDLDEDEICAILAAAEAGG